MGLLRPWLDVSSSPSTDTGFFVHAIEEISKDINHFDSIKFPCAICGDKGHAFNKYPQLQGPDSQAAYICLCVLFFLITTAQKLKRIF